MVNRVMSLHKRAIVRLARNLLLTILALEMARAKVGIKADLTNYLSQPGSNYDLTSGNQYITPGSRGNGLQQQLIRCSLLEEPSERQECALRLWLIDLIHQNKNKLSRDVSNNKDVVNSHVRGELSLEYLTVIENCMNKCDVWRSRVNYYNCMKSCKRENKIIQSLEGRSVPEVRTKFKGKTTQDSRSTPDVKCDFWLCSLDRSRCGHSCDRQPVVKRQLECMDGECRGFEQPRKRRWGDTLTTCIASYCNSLGGVSRVDCIINKCDKQRRG